MKNKPESYQSILAPYITGLLEEKKGKWFFLYRKRNDPVAV